MCNTERADKVNDLVSLLDLQDDTNPRIKTLDAIYFQISEIIDNIGRSDIAHVNAKDVMEELKTLWFKYDEIYFDVRNMGNGYYAKILDELYYYIKGLAIDLDEYIYHLGVKEVCDDLKSLWKKYDSVYDDLKNMVSYYS